MKTLRWLALAALLPAWNLSAQTAGDLIATGRAALAAKNLSGAYSNFNAAVTADPNNPAANVLVAGTRLLLLPQQPAITNFLNRLGLPAAGRDIFNWTAQLPRDTNGDIIFPPALNSTEGIVVVSNTILPAIRACLANLAQVTDTNFTLHLTAAETSVQDATIDYGDVLLFRAVLSAVDFAGHTLNGHNLNVVLNHLEALGKSDQFSIQQVLKDYPYLFAQPNKPEIAASKIAFTNAINLYFAASDFIRNRAASVQGLFNLDAQMLDKEATFRSDLAIALASVSQPVVASPNNGRMVYAGAYFDGTHSLRSLLPQFNGNTYVNNSLPDYTLGGVLPDMPAYLTEAALRKKLGFTYAGIYTGEVDDWYNGYSGEFAVIVRTNMHATLVGYNLNQGTGILADFTIEKDGYWEFDSPDGGHAWGNLYQDGTLDGQASAPGGMGGASIWGQRVPEAGPFQTADGYYPGTWTGVGTGWVNGILCPDGRLYYASSDDSGTLADGGECQFDAANRLTSVVDARGSAQGGTLNRTAATITGLYTNADYSHGGFMMTRTAHVLSDTPPAIASAPADKSATTGDTVTFSVVASGSAPLCYQWYSNSVAILHATGTSLVLNSVQMASAASYSVDVHNLAGVTNVAASLQVVPETVPPKVLITSPAVFQRVSNAVFTVRGTANDAGGVSNIWIQVGSGPATPASGTTSWTATINLSKGTNLVQVYAVDTSGNQSVVKSTTLVYVPSALLTLSTSGLGTLAALPTWSSNTLLEIGRLITVTATPKPGYMFSNWVDGAGTVVSTKPKMAFSMASGLVFQANFVPYPFGPLRGSYAGLFCDTNGATATNSGRFTATVNAQGGFSSSFQLSAVAYPFAGQFSASGFYSNTIPRRGLTPLSAQLQLDMAGHNSLEGWLSDGAWTARIEADRAVYAGTNYAPQAGKYTLAIPGGTNAATQPGGYGFGAATVGAYGNVTFSGTLGDGVKATATTVISDRGQWPLCLFPYTNASKGLVLGWLTFTNDTALNSDLEGPVSWVRLAQPSAKLYKSDFALHELGVFGSRYTNRVPGLSWSNCLMGLDGGNLSQPFAGAITNWVNYKVTGTNKLNLTVIGASGLFSGSVLNPSTGKAVLVSGALLQRQNAGYGVFSGTNQSGYIYLGR